MVSSQYVVINTFDNLKTDIKIPAQYKMILKLLKADMVFQPKDIQSITSKRGILNIQKNSRKSVIQRSLKFGIELGMLKKQSLEHHSIISFDEFCKKPMINQWIHALNPPNLKNIKRDKYSGTRGSYANKLHQFHSWLSGKNFIFTILRKTDSSHFEEINESILLDGVDHFLNLFQQKGSYEIEFIKIIKQFLNDPKYENDYQSTVNQRMYAIKSFFKEHDYPITFSFNVKRFRKTDADDETPSLTLNDFMSMLTVGKPSVMEKALFLCKFHRGLDSNVRRNPFPDVHASRGTKLLAMISCKRRGMLDRFAYPAVIMSDGVLRFDINSGMRGKKMDYSRKCPYVIPIITYMCVSSLFVILVLFPQNIISWMVLGI